MNNRIIVKKSRVISHFYCIFNCDIIHRNIERNLLKAVDYHSFEKYTFKKNRKSILRVILVVFYYS